MRCTHRTFLLASLLLASCGSKGPGTPIERPTLIEVDPSLIVGDLCGDAPGALRRYVATVVDTTPFMNEIPPEGLCPSDNGAAGAPGVSAACPPFSLPSSPPLSCTRAVGFGNVTPGHRYIGRLDGYDRDDLTPLAVGSSVMLDPEGSPVLPAWAWICDRDVVSAENWSVPLQGCHPIARPDQPVGETTLYVRLEELCASAPEGATIARLSVTAGVNEEISGVLDETDLDCSDTASLPAAPGAAYKFRVSAMAASDETVTYETDCFGVAREGQSQPASCDPLREPEPPEQVP